MITHKALLRGILTIVYVGQGEEKKEKYKEIKVQYLCLTELELRIYLHTSPRGQLQVILAETEKHLKLTPRANVLKWDKNNYSQLTKMDDVKCRSKTSLHKTTQNPLTQRFLFSYILKAAMGILYDLPMKIICQQAEAAEKKKRYCASKTFRH